VNGGVSIDERVVEDPLESCSGDAALVKVLKTEMEDEEELALRVEAGSEGTKNGRMPKCWKAIMIV
jgi:hypothetical protein